MCSRSKCSISFRFPKKTLYTFLVYPLHATCPAHLILRTWPDSIWWRISKQLLVTVSPIFGMVTILICHFKCLIKLIGFETYEYTLACQDSTVSIDHEYNNSWHVLLLIINNSSCRLRLGDAWSFVIDYERKVFRYWLREKASYWLRPKMHDKLRYGSRRISRYWSHGSSGYWSRDKSCRWSQL